MVEPKQFQIIEEKVGDEVLESDDNIHGRIISLLSHTNLCNIGAPGVAKSFVSRRIVDRIDPGPLPEGHVLYFKSTITKYTAERHVFGPDNVPAFLEKGEQRRNINGFLPTARIWLAEEMWKGGNISNSVLTISNEHEYEENGEIIQVPLWCIWATSNELPADDSYRAIADRMLQWFWTDPPQDPENLRAMMRMEALGTIVEEPDKIITWQDVVDAYAQARQVDVPDEIFDALIEIRGILREQHHIDISPRRLNGIVRLIQAEAYFNERSKADVSDVAIAVNACWTDPEQIEVVEKLILGMTNPDHAEIVKISTDIGEMNKDIEAAIKEHDPIKKARAGVALQRKLVQNANSLSSFKGKPLSPRTRILANKCKRSLDFYAEKLMIEVQGLPAKAVRGKGISLLDDDK